ncbi:hypothetical protein [Candidatus Gromoviella agglomerans]|uniref:hypothetical protein n=1 Tax=Candidatus Gromoviella agglomerans TaxID=2806609 RepID=UPI001E609BD8|nr:hypothetical protein [Candidatus Gromoviella agglomerans]UFX98143.1 hypothetical protein Gromo_00022 [Candidatus Gromoviella agglomerans]
MKVKNASIFFFSAICSVFLTYSSSNAMMNSQMGSEVHDEDESFKRQTTTTKQAVETLNERTDDIQKMIKQHNELTSKAKRRDDCFQSIVIFCLSFTCISHIATAVILGLIYGLLDKTYEKVESISLQIDDAI